MGIKSLIKQYLTEKENKKYDTLLASKKVTYGQWLVKMEAVWSSDCREKAKEEDFLVVQFGEGEFVPDWKERIGVFLAANPKVQVVYADEDILDADEEPENPWFKPDWSPDLLDSYQYFGSFVAVRKTHFDKIKGFYDRIDPESFAGLFGTKKLGDICRVTDLQGAEKWLHHCTSPGLRKGADAIGHIPQILFHAACEEARKAFFEPSDFLKDQRKAMLQGFFERELTETENAKPFVSVMIPSKDHPEILRECLEGIRRAAEVSIEIIVVDNGSTPANRELVQKLLQDMEQSEGGNVPFCCRYLYEPMEFNFSRMCNLAAQEATSNLLLFLNDDVVLQEKAISELGAYAGRNYTGAVGMKLLYPQEKRIQHAGITNLPMGPVHKLQTLNDDKVYYAKANRVTANYSAVTAACLMIEKKKFLEVGGFEETLAVAFNDVDLCFKLSEAGYFNVCLNDCFSYHYESLSRGGDDESEEKVARLLAERDLLYDRHPNLRGVDPYYSSYLNRDGLDVRIAPAYETSANRVQKAEQIERVTSLGKVREDNCLMVRVEDMRGHFLSGYSAVLGDDNACYERSLVLKSQDEEAFYLFPLQGQYRPDLAENMPDQKNVALGGFAVYLSTSALSKGRYKVGILARNRVTGLKLLHYSNRTVDLSEQKNTF